MAGDNIDEEYTAEETVKTLRTLLARMGLPQQIVSDNGPPFTSDVFKFVTSWGRHIILPHTDWQSA